MEIIDNFLTQKEYKNFYQDIMSPEFAWFYNDFKISAGEKEQIQDFQFTHSFWLDGVASNKIEMLKPLLKKIGKPSLLRAKANLGAVTEKHYAAGLHVDNNTSLVFTGIYYVNDNNGYTLFKNGTKVESKANRFLEFESKEYHSGVSQTNTKRRVVVNLNYLK